VHVATHLGFDYVQKITYDIAFEQANDQNKIKIYLRGNQIEKDQYMRIS